METLVNLIVASFLYKLGLFSSLGKIKLRSKSIPYLRRIIDSYRVSNWTNSSCYWALLCDL